MFTQIAGFVDLFVWLLLLKSFFLPLYVIPTGSMAETLAGAAARHTCPNCGWDYQVGFDTQNAPRGPLIVECPNCRFQETTAAHPRGGTTLDDRFGDRIVTHGWTYDLGIGPDRWDVVVFKNPNNAADNYIKRLIGLPGETIEIIDGDVWVTPPGAATPKIARKTRHAQEALWFHVYDHDYPPAKPSANVIPNENERDWSKYHPRFAAVATAGAWKDIDSRTPRFDGVQADRAEIQFVTQPGETTEPGLIQDNCGYNAYGSHPARPRPFRAPLETVTDTRLSATVRILDGSGYVELSTTKNSDTFEARLFADGRVTLERRTADGSRQSWPSSSIHPDQSEHRVSIAHADYGVAVAVDGHELIRTDDASYSVTAEDARQHARRRHTPKLRIAADHVRAEFSHLRIERDVSYTSSSWTGRPGVGVQGHPTKLRDDAYFVCGDNSANSHDARWWSEDELGAHLRSRLDAGTYSVGSVPADQMLGRAFLVYCPGFAPLPGFPQRTWNLVPDFGRIRWIH